MGTLEMYDLTLGSMRDVFEKLTMLTLKSHLHLETDVLPFREML
jgi:hypothetical protein